MKKTIWFPVVLVAALLFGCSSPTEPIPSNAVMSEYNGKVAWASPHDYFPRVAETTDVLSDSLIHGDVSGNGTITAYDATLVLRHVVRLDTLPNPLDHDVTNNGTLTAYDASFILTRVVNPSFVFPIDQVE